MKATSYEIQLFEPRPGEIYTIETTAQLAEVPRRSILRYCKRRLVSSVVDPTRDGFYFDQRGIRRLRQIEAIRKDCNDPLSSIKVILDLMSEIKQLQRQILSRSGSPNGKSQNETSTSRRTT
jgi:DNA-binding transcriptional MerR regulator